MTNLDLMFGKELSVNGITFRFPTVSDIIDLGEEEYFSCMNPFILKMSDMMVELYDCGIDYREANPYDVFLTFYADTLIYKDGKLQADISGKPLLNTNSKSGRRLCWLTGIDDFKFWTDGKSCFLYSESTGCVIDEPVYKIAKQYYSKIHYISDKDKFNPGNETTLKFLVKQEKRNRELRSKNRNQGFIASKVSALIWSTGISFDDAKKLNVYQLFDGLSRIERIKSYDFVNIGYYGGNIRQKDYKRLVENVDWSA